MRYLLLVLLGLIYASVVYPNSIQRLLDRKNIRRFNQKLSSDSEKELKISKMEKRTCIPNQGNQVLVCEDSSTRTSPKMKRIPEGAGGRPVEWKSFKWHVMLRHGFDNNGFGNFVCGGVLVRRQYMLTAAHCICPYPEKCNPKDGWQCQQNENYQVVYGDDIDTKNKKFYRPVRASWIPHTYAKPGKGGLDDDVAILILNESFPDDYSTCQNEEDVERERIGNINNCVGIGRGKTSDKSTNNNGTLYEIPVKEKPCRGYLDDHRKICFVGEWENSTTKAVSCDKDSGSPIVCKDNRLDSKYIVAGIYSTKTAGSSCPGSDSVSIATRISNSQFVYHHEFVTPSVLEGPKRCGYLLRAFRNKTHSACR